ncbi:hypothetical protein PG990_005026 [Apiospora arundinis]
MRGKPFQRPQCRTCRNRRIRCTSEHPRCAVCCTAGLECPGYSQTKSEPAVSKCRRLSLLVGSGSGSESGLSSVSILPSPVLNGLREDDICTPSTALETIYYYNQTMGRDIGAACVIQEMLTPGEWLECSPAQRHIFMCMTKLHRTIQTLPPNCDTLEVLPWHALPEMARRDITVFSHHQAEALRIVQKQLEDPAAAAELDANLFSSLIGLLMSHIQQGAFGVWRSHLQGAKALLDRWGPSSHLELDDHEYFALMTVDMYHATTSPSRQLSAQAWDQHSAYLGRIPHFSSMVIHTLTPVPSELLTAVALINMRRFPVQDSTEALYQGTQECHTTASAILELIRSFRPQSWLEEVLPAQNDTECGDDGATDKLAVWQPPGPRGPVPDDAPELEAESVAPQRAEAYNTLTRCIAHLFTPRVADSPAAGRHYKFIIWPMVMAGVEAVVTYRDDHQVAYICSYLRLLAMELGTFTMRQAARFLEDLASTYQKKGATYEYKGRADWDEIFRYSAIFLL